MAIDALRRGEPAWRFGYDWDAFDSRTVSRVTMVDPAPVVILESPTSVWPELAHIVDLQILLVAGSVDRRAQLRVHDGDTWHDTWHNA